MAALQFTDAQVPRPLTLHPAAPPQSRSRRLSSRVAAPAVGEGVRPGLAVVVVVVSLLVGSAVAGAGGRPRGDGAPSGFEHEAALGVPTVAARGRFHLVQPGETYWSIARGLRGVEGGDLRPVVDVLVEANGADPLQAGDRVVLPPTSGGTPS